MYVKCVVVVRPFRGQKMYVSNVVQPVTDYNQITYHLLNVFLAHAQRTKGFLPKADQQNANANQNQPIIGQHRGGMNVNTFTTNVTSTSNDPKTKVKSKTK